MRKTFTIAIASRPSPPSRSRRRSVRRPATTAATPVALQNALSSSWPLCVVPVAAVAPEASTMPTETK
jgi:hypothetical protein